MKFKLFGLHWDLTPVFILFGILWTMWCMFGAMAINKDTSGFYVAFYFISVIVTLALIPTLDKIFNNKD